LLKTLIEMGADIDIEDNEGSSVKKEIEGDEEF
jgi:hypothetical protein